MSTGEQLATREQAGRTCPYCRFSFKAGVVLTECGSCKALHHAECWEENRGCAVMACSQAPATPGARDPEVPPAPVQPQPTQQQPAFASGNAQQPASTSPVMPLPPSTGEIVDRLRAVLSTPIVAAAGRAGATAAAAMLAVGFVTAIVSPDASRIGSAGVDSGLVGETARLTVATTLARFGFSGFHITYLPLLFVLVPLAGAAYGASRQAHRTVSLSPRTRLLAGAATGVPLAALMLVVALFAKHGGLGFSGGSVILYSLLWGGLGGAVGAARAVGPASRSAFDGLLAPRLAHYLRLAWIALKPLGLLLAMVGVIALTVWTVQAARGQSSAIGSGHKVTSLVENPLYIGELAIDNVALGSLATFHALGEDGGSTVPLPLNDGGKFDGFDKPWRIFTYGHNYPVYSFVFLLILLIGLPLALAAYGGFAVAAAAGAQTAVSAAGHGMVVGAAWAVSLTLLRAIDAQRLIDGDSLFVAVLLGAGVAGALGGLLSRVRAA